MSVRNERAITHQASTFVSHFTNDSQSEELSNCRAEDNNNIAATPCFSFSPEHRNSSANSLPPPIGVFWDIENCQVPRNTSAASIVHRIRELFYVGHREAEFVVVCDVQKERPQVINDLQDAQVNLNHVSATFKNAADDKLRQALRRFGETYSPPATVVLVSGDVNFAADLSDLRYRRKIHIILVHNVNAVDALRQYAHECVPFNLLTDNLPSFKSKAMSSVDLLITNLPATIDKAPLKNRLKQLSYNCGGRVINIDTDDGTAIIRFVGTEFAQRALRRLNGEDVFGMKITASSLPKSTKMPKPLESVPSSTSWPSSQATDVSRMWGSSPSCTPDFLDSLHSSHTPSATVELIITNLDASIGDLRLVIASHLKQYTNAFNVAVTYQENKPTATVKLASQHDAEYVISKMHHQKIGARRISIAYARTKSLDLAELKECVVYVLQESSTKSMPLYMLLKLLEEKYLMNVPLAEINKLRDVCHIIESNGERLVSLTAKMRASPMSQLAKPQQLHYCYVHCPNGINAWMLEAHELPCVFVSLAELATIVGRMLDSHMGTLPLMSFMLCYKHEFGTFLTLDSVNGVPLEHLVTCIPHVRLRQDGTKSKAKYIVWEYGKPSDDNETFKGAATSSPLATSISQLKREFIDLLKSAPKCQIPLSKYVPAYHHHFGRQLRVASYGYTKLDELLHSPHLSHVVQIIGGGPNRVLTLTHAAQKRRFISDLLRMLKSQVNKQLALSDLPEVYEKVLNKPYNIIEYGVCYVDDMLAGVPENLIRITSVNQECLIAIPQRVRTPDEILRTRHFAGEVVKLLSHSPNCSMHFDKFVPHYHHHFGRQCKVSEYGFTKLFELFEAIPDTVKVEELANGQRIICLTPTASLKLFGTRIAKLIMKTPSASLLYDQLEAAYFCEYKTHINPQMHNCANVDEILAKLKDFVSVHYSGSGKSLILADNNAETTLVLRVWSLLVKPPHHCDADVLLASYAARYQSTMTMNHLELMNHVILTRTTEHQVTVYLIPEFAKAAKIYNLLHQNGGQVPFHTLESLYQSVYNETLLVAGVSNNYEKFLCDFGFLIVLSHSRKRTSISLNPKLAELGLPVGNLQDLLPRSRCSWPPLPLPPSYLPSSSYNMGNSFARRSPPKPDTPPAGGALMEWQQQSPSKPFEKMEFSINLPEPVTPKMAPQTLSFISPVKGLLPAHPMGTLLFSFASPDPSELPHPDKLLRPSDVSGVLSDDSADSGVNNSNHSQYTSENEQESTQEQRLSIITKPTKTDMQSSCN